MKDKLDSSKLDENVVFKWAGNIRRGSRTLCTEGRGTEGVHSCVDNKATVEERKGQAAT